MFLLILLFGTGVYAQTVNGVVRDDGALPGATIQIKGTNTGVTTDFDGNFSIDANENDILVVSFIGYATQEVTVSGQDDLSITLVSDSELEEIVLTGYGSQRREELTSAITTIKSEDFNEVT